MSWIKVISINILVLIVLLILLEVGAGVGRVLIGEDYKFPNLETTYDVDHPAHPCNEMRTDVLLSHAPNTPDLCSPKGGKVVGEYVIYDVSDNKNPVLLTLGGSTTSGFYQQGSGGDTFPKLLAELAKDQYFVMNGGISGYSSVQEMYKFIRDGSRIENLKVVVSLNGINDVPDYQGRNDERSVNYPYLTESQYKMNVHQKWIDRRFAVGFHDIMPNVISLLDYLEKKHIGWATPVGENEDLNASLASTFMLPIDAADRWEKNVTRMNQLVALEGARYYVLLQPTLGLEGAQSTAPAGSKDAELLSSLNKGYIDMIRTVYEELKARCAMLDFCYDISDEAPPTGNVYTDARHHNANGNQLLARGIWTILK